MYNRFFRQLFAKPESRIILIAVLIKLSYIVYSVGIIHFFPGQVGNNYNNEGRHFINFVFRKNDGGWYKGIAENGYPKLDIDSLYKEDSNSKYQTPYSFFPLFPAAIRAGMSVFSLDFEASGFIFSTLFSFIAFILVYRFIKRLKGETIAYHAVILLMIFPFHFFFSVMYTEGLFLLLLIACFLAIMDKRWWLLGVCSFLMVLERPNGITMAPPLFLFYLEENNLTGKGRTKLATLKDIKEKLGPLLVFMAMPLALALYCMFLKERTGDYFAFLTAQKGWNKHTMFPLNALFRNGSWQYQFNSFYFIICMLITIFISKKIRFSLLIYVWLGLLLPATAGSLVSIPRYISLLFPFMMIAAEYVWVGHRKYIILPLLFVLQLITFYFWLSGDLFCF